MALYMAILFMFRADAELRFLSGSSVSHAGFIQKCFELSGFGRGLRDVVTSKVLAADEDVRHASLFASSSDGILHLCAMFHDVELDVCRIHANTFHESLGRFAKRAVSLAVDQHLRAVDVGVDALL